MKLNNEIVVLDLEATAGTDEDGYQTNNDIIDIGAVLLDTKLVIVDRFEALVRPQEPISAFITELTGISNEMVLEAPDFGAVGPAFEAWIRAHAPNI